MRYARLFFFCGVLLAASSSQACSSQEGDPPSNHGVPPPEGKDFRIREVTAPDSPNKAQPLSSVAISGAVVTGVDTFDETGTGSTGTIYVQDLGSTEPYSGISLFSPAFIPGNLRVGAGDVLDLRGQYQENQGIGASVTFAPGAVLPQLGRPVATFRFDGRVPPPVELSATDVPNKPSLSDLADYTKGRRWMGMLVRVKNVTLPDDLFVATSGRANVRLMPDQSQGQTACDSPFPKVPTLVNEFAPLSAERLKKGTVIKSLTGIVTYFCNFHIAPRTPEDVEL